MDAHQPVTLKEGDRYPLGPPSICPISLMVEHLFCNQGMAVRFCHGAPSFYLPSVMAAYRSPKPLVGVRVPGGMRVLKYMDRSSIG
jgi:hypothetical protein